jgi:hypothetical protein
MAGFDRDENDDQEAAAASAGHPSTAKSEQVHERPAAQARAIRRATRSA